MKSRRDDYFAALLRANGNAAELNKIIQDKCRRKAARKLAATLASTPDFRFPTELSAEQCTSDDLADFHASLIAPGSSVVDLTAGLGIDDFHIARKASEVVSIELDPAVAGCLTPNARALGISNLTAINADSVSWITENRNRHFDVAFIDPARRASDGSRLYSLADCSPDVTSILNDIEQIASRLIIKASPMLDITKVISELRNVSAIYAVGTKSECKELIIDIRFGETTHPAICAATIGEPLFRLQPSDTERRYATEIREGDLIGEPFPSVAKLRPTEGFGGEQLHPSTLLWRNPSGNFPGQTYRVDRIEEFSSSAIRRLSREKIKASVATRNFTLSAEELRRRLKSEENSEMRLIATTLYPNEQKLLFLVANSAKNA